MGHPILWLGEKNGMGAPPAKKHPGWVRGLPLIHDKTVDEWGTNGWWLFHDRATCRIVQFCIRYRVSFGRPIGRKKSSHCT